MLQQRESAAEALRDGYDHSDASILCFHISFLRIVMNIAGSQYAKQCVKIRDVDFKFGEWA